MPKTKELTEEEIKKSLLKRKDQDEDDDEDEKDEDDQEEEDEDDEDNQNPKSGMKRSSSKSWEVKKKRVFLYGFRRTLIAAGFEEKITGIDNKREVYTLKSPDGKFVITGYLKKNEIDINGTVYAVS
jgi:hypothetical protein